MARGKKRGEGCGGDEAEGVPFPTRTDFSSYKLALCSSMQQQFKRPLDKACFADFVFPFSSYMV